MFEKLQSEDELIEASVFPGNSSLEAEWLQRVVPLLQSATLGVPVSLQKGAYSLHTIPDYGGRKKKHSTHLRSLIEDLQSVYQSVPGAKW